MPVKVQQVIDPQPMCAGYKTITGISSCKEPEVPTRMMLSCVRFCFNRPCFKIDIHQCIQFIQNNINIICADAGGHN